MRFPEYNIFQALYPNITKAAFEEMYGSKLTLDDFCAKVGSYIVARIMYPNDQDPMNSLYQARLQERQVSQRNGESAQRSTGCCGGGSVK